MSYSQEAPPSPAETKNKSSKRSAYTLYNYQVFASPFRPHMEQTQRPMQRTSNQHAQKRPRGKIHSGTGSGLCLVGQNQEILWDQ